MNVSTAHKDEVMHTGWMRSHNLLAACRNWVGCLSMSVVPAGGVGTATTEPWVVVTVCKGENHCSQVYACLL